MNPFIACMNFCWFLPSMPATTWGRFSPISSIKIRSLTRSPRCSPATALGMASKWAINPSASSNLRSSIRRLAAITPRAATMLLVMASSSGTLNHSSGISRSLWPCASRAFMVSCSQKARRASGCLPRERAFMPSLSTRPSRMGRPFISAKKKPMRAVISRRMERTGTWRSAK